MDKIDFVILWVDGNDENWLNEKKMYKPSMKTNESDGDNRYRDWDNLKYWFRAIEENADWVNKIYFITWGHIPQWLDIKNEKIKIVKHSDYIPKQYLPTYNSNTIEMNLFRIDELGENFVLFNDDMFIMEKTKKEDFFKNNMPVEFYSEIINSDIDANSIYAHNLLNNMSIINKYYNKKAVYKKSFFKYFNLKYGLKGNMSTFLLSFFDRFSLIVNPHVPVSLTKSTLKKIWELEPDIMDTSCKNRFRNLTDITQYLIRYFQLASGKFYPRKYNYGKAFNLDNENKYIIKELEKRKYKIVCFNDSGKVTDFEASKRILNDYLEKRFPEKSKYEL